MAYSQHRLHNFYHKFETSEREHIELYIGRSAGEQLSRDLKNAQQEITIISPYIDQEKAKDLIKLSKEGKDIKLAFTDLDLNKDTHQHLIRTLTMQEQKEDSELEAKKQQKLSQNLSYIIFSTVGIVLLLLLANYLMPQYFNQLALILPFAAILLLASLLKKRSMINKQSTYSYEYWPKINFKILKDDSDTPQTHSKIFLFDGEIAYLGSLNFTNSGFKHNFETLIRVTKSRQIKELSNFTSSFFNDTNEDTCRNLEEVCRTVYNEPSD